VGGCDRSWKEPIRVAIAQTRLVVGDVSENLGGAIDLLNRSRSDDADLVILPEAFTTGFPFRKLPDLVHRSEEALETLMSWAKASGTAMIFTLAVEEGGRYYNRCFHIGSDGGMAGKYDKTHLFQPTGEDAFFTRGETLTLFEMGDMRIGPLTCYEVRYPELSRKLALRGAHLLVYTAEWPLHRVFQWELLLRARALENQCFVSGVNICGDHERVAMGGHSMIVSPTGEVITSLGEGPDTATALLEPYRLYDFRDRIPAFYSRREDLY